MECVCGGGGGMDVVVGGEMVPDPGLPESSVVQYQTILKD